MLIYSLASFGLGLFLWWDLDKEHSLLLLPFVSAASVVDLSFFLARRSPSLCLLPASEPEADSLGFFSSLALFIGPVAGCIMVFTSMYRMIVDFSGRGTLVGGSLAIASVFMALLLIAASLFGLVRGSLFKHSLSRQLCVESAGYIESVVLSDELRDFCLQETGIALPDDIEDQKSRKTLATLLSERQCILANHSLGVLSRRLNRNYMRKVIRKHAPGTCARSFRQLVSRFPDKFVRAIAFSITGLLFLLLLLMSVFLEGNPNPSAPIVITYVLTSGLISSIFFNFALSTPCDPLDFFTINAFSLYCSFICGTLYLLVALNAFLNLPGIDFALFPISSVFEEFSLLVTVAGVAAVVELVKRATAEERD